MRRRKLITFTYVLTAVVAFITLRIEWLNVEAGGVLPRHEYFNDDPAQGLVKWRASSTGPDEESHWRQRHRIDDRPLTPNEQSQLNLEIRQANANNALRDFVSSAGLLQYLLAPLLILASIVTAGFRGIRHGLLPFAVGVAACVVIYWRAYFTSLGW